MYKPTFEKRSVLKFKHFSNHGYSLFAVLGKEVLIGVLSVATLQHATAKGISVNAEKAEMDSVITNRGVMMDEVSVTGTRAPLTVSQQARMVTVLSREDIQAAPVQSVTASISVMHKQVITPSISQLILVKSSASKFLKDLLHEFMVRLLY